jgi:hypothetical protein
MAMRQHGADQGGIVVGEEAVERGNGCQATVDGGGLEAAGDLGSDEAVDVVEVHVLGRPIADDGGELCKITAVVAERAGVGIASSEPIDKALDLR